MTSRRMTFACCFRRPPGASSRNLGRIITFLIAVFLALPPAQAQNYEDAVAGEVPRAEMALLDVNHYLSEGDNFAADGNWARAFSNYRAAFELLPQDRSGDSFRDGASQRYAEATVRFAEELIERNRAREARMIIEEVLDPQRVPGHPAATELLKRLEDPEWVSPAATPKHLEEVDQVTKLLGEAETLMNMGEYDEATNKFSEVLNIDETNGAARDGLVKASRLTQSYRNASYDKSRAELLDELMKKWEFNAPGAGRRAVRPATIPDVGAMEDAPQSSDIAQRLANIIIPEVNLNNLNIDTAVRYLERLSREHDPSGQGINFVLSTSENIDRSRPLTVTLNSIPLIVLVQYVTELVGAQYRIEQYAVHIVPLEDDEITMVPRSFLVPPDFFVTGGVDDDGEDPFGVGTGRVRTVSERQYLEQRGITFPEGASAQYLPSSNRLIVRNTLSNLELIDSLVSTSAMAAPKQVNVKVTVLDIRQDDLEELGFDWLVGGFDVDDVIAGGGSLVDPVDTAAAQPGFLPESSDFTFVDPATGEVFGGQRVTGGLRSGQGPIGADALDRIVGVDRETALSTNLGPSLFSIKGQFTKPQFQAVLRGLNQQKAGDVVTAPSVTVKPGFRAKIESGTEFIYPIEYDPPELPQEVTLLSSGGVFPVTPAHPTTFETRALGFNLEVEPAISADNSMVTMTLNPEFVEFVGFVNYGSAITAAGTDLLGNPTNILVTDNQLLTPVFSTIRQTVEATLYDGATLVIGGLTEDRRISVQDKVPILGDLPLIGRLFRSNIDRRRSRVVVIFVTAKIIDAKGARIAQIPGAPEDTEFGFVSP